MSAVGKRDQIQLRTLLNEHDTVIECNCNVWASFYTQRQQRKMGVCETRGRCYVWSQFSAIFANFRLKNWRFSQICRYCLIFVKNSSSLSQKRQFFRKNFRGNFLKNYNIGPSINRTKREWQTAVQGQRINHGNNNSKSAANTIHLYNKGLTIQTGLKLSALYVGYCFKWN
jgi:hypothetical protein